MITIGAEDARADHGERQRADGQTERAQGKQAIFHLRGRELAGQQAAQPTPIARAASGKPLCSSPSPRCVAS